MFHQFVKWFDSSRLLLQLYSVLLVLGTITLTATSATDNQKPVRELVEGIRQAHARLLHAPQGLGLQYRLDVEQDRNNPSFIWMNGLDGLVNIRWPRVRSRIEGEMFKFKFKGEEKRLVSEKIVREANYDFESNRSVGHDGTALGQITNFRHSFSANTAFPLNFQYYAEMDQFYNPSEPLKTESLLPDALEQYEYQRTADEDVEGTTCAVLKRAPLDTIWIAASKNYVVCKREQRLASGGLYARMLSTDIREVAPGLWIPHKQIQEVFNPDTGTRIFKLTLRITKVTIPITDEDTKVVLGKDIKRIENFMDKKTYYPQQPSGVRDYASLSRAIKMAKEGDRNKTKRGMYVRYVGLIGFCVFVGAMILCIYLRYKRRKVSL